MVDELVSNTRFITEVGDSVSFEQFEDYVSGIPVSGFENGKVFVFNHLDLFILTHKTLDETYRIVGFDVEPRSLAWGTEACTPDREWEF